MRNLNIYAICILLIINLSQARSQINLTAGPDQSISCSGSVQLKAEPVLNGSWEKIETGLSELLGTIYFINDSVGFMIGSTGKIYKTYNRGINWEIKNSGTTNNLYDLKFYNDSVGIAVGGLGTIIKTNDGGENWSPQNSGVTSTLNSISFYSASKILVAGSYGIILKTSDGGENWNQNTLLSTINFTDIAINSQGYGYICTNFGQIYWTENFGLSWTKSNVDTEHSLRSIEYVDEYISYAVGSGGTIKRTYDGGHNWSGFQILINNIDSISGFSVSKINFEHIQFLTSQIGYIVGYDKTYGAMVLKTKNGGYSWDMVAKYDTYKAMAGYFPSVNTGFICGTSGLLAKLSPEIIEDNGIYSWTPITGLSNPNSINTIASPTETTTYTVTRIAENSYLADSVTVFVTPIVVYPMDKKNIVCDGSVKLDGVITNYKGNGELKYKWTPSAGLDNDTIAAPTATVSANTTYTVEISTAGGCKATETVAVYVGEMTVNAGENKTAFCGDTIQLDAVTTNYIGNGKLHYKWTPATGLNNDTILNPRVVINSNTNYIVTVTTDKGCSSTDNVNVTVNQLTVNAGNDLTTICNQPILLNTPITNYTGSNRLNYKWSPSEGLNNDTLANPTATITNNTEFTVTVSTPGGCSASDKIKVNVVTMDKPVLNVVSINGNNKNTLSWSKTDADKIQYYKIYKETNQTEQYELIGTRAFDSTSIFVDTLSSPDVQSNKYKISIIDDCGNETELSDYHKTMHLSINKGVNNSWNLIWEPYIGFNVTTYNIYRGSIFENLQQIGSLSGSNTQFSDFTANSEFVYYRIEALKSTTANAPKQNVKGIQKSSSSTEQFSSVSNVATNAGGTGLSEITDFSNSISLYPNPAKDKIHLIINKDIESEFQMKIYNLLGTIVKEETISSNNQQIELNDIPSGIYMMIVCSDKYIAKQRLIIQ